MGSICSVPRFTKLHRLARARRLRAHHMSSADVIRNHHRDVQDDNGETPLHALMIHFAPDEAAHLAAEMVTRTNVNLPDASGNTPLHIVLARRCNNATFLAPLVTRTNRNTENAHGQTPLHTYLHAVDAHEYLADVVDLLRTRHNLCVRCAVGETPFEIAARRRTTNIRVLNRLFVADAVSIDLCDNLHALVAVRFPRRVCGLLAVSRDDAALVAGILASSEFAAAHGRPLERAMLAYVRCNFRKISLPDDLRAEALREMGVCAQYAHAIGDYVADIFCVELLTKTSVVRKLIARQPRAASELVCGSRRVLRALLVDNDLAVHRALCCNYEDAGIVYALLVAACIHGSECVHIDRWHARVRATRDAGLRAELEVLLAILLGRETDTGRLRGATNRFSHITRDMAASAHSCAMCMSRLHPAIHATIGVCGHKFHKKCIDAYLHKKSESFESRASGDRGGAHAPCPICRRAFRRDEVHYSYISAHMLLPADLANETVARGVGVGGRLAGGVPASAASSSSALGGSSDEEVRG